MSKGFSKFDVLLIIGIIVFAFLSYDRFIKKDSDMVVEEIQQATSTEETKGIVGGKEAVSIKTNDDKATDSNLGEYKTILEKNLNGVPIEDTRAKDAVASPVDNTPTTDNGYYKNNTYNYEITCPASWPLKIRQESDVSIGTVPPKNGLGAITITVGGNAGDEVEQMKKEASKYSGVVSISEESIALSGVTGTKITMNNSIAKTKDVFILLEKNKVTYTIKYSEVSSGFTKLAEEAVETFKFL